MASIVARENPVTAASWVALSRRMASAVEPELLELMAQIDGPDAHPDQQPNKREHGGRAKNETPVRTLVFDAHVVLANKRNKERKHYFCFFPLMAKIPFMPRYGFTKETGQIGVRLSKEQTATVMKMLNDQGIQPSTLGKALVAAACRFLDEGGRIALPLEIRPANYSEAQPKLALVAEDAATVREILAEAKAALADPTPPQVPPDLPELLRAAKGSRAKKSRKKSAPV